MVPGAYALSRKGCAAAPSSTIAVAFTLWFHAGMIPFFLNMRDLGLLDAVWASSSAFACNAFNVILLRNYFEAVPKSFEEAAQDGRRQRIAAAVEGLHPAFQARHRHRWLLFCIVSRWNGYFWAMVLLRGEEKIPLQVYLKRVIVDLNSNDEVRREPADRASIHSRRSRPRS